MRLLIATIIALTVSLAFFVMVKIWGSSQPYGEYSHPYFTPATQQTTQGSTDALVFKILTPQSLTEGLKTEKNIYLNIAITSDLKLIIIDKDYEAEKQFVKKVTAKLHSRLFSDITDGTPNAAVLVENYKNQLKDKKIIFNMQDNPLQGTTVFVDTMKLIGLDAGNNFLFISAFDPPSKDLKSQQATYIYGTSDPEILRIKALESLYLIEASTFRADVVIHPLTYFKQPFFTEVLLNELKRRHKRFIIGPLIDGEMNHALALKPFGVIVK
ncbi:MAG: hypothetical protein H7235_10145 [Bdellovibrionaceae bacterium]|nr:hypothetical protein [Pseudobdellovibrionaceae bacterium]